MSKFMNQVGLKRINVQNNQYEYIADKFITSVEDYFLKREVKKILVLSYVFRTDIVFYILICLFPPYFTQIMRNTLLKRLISSIVCPVYKNHVKS